MVETVVECDCYHRTFRISVSAIIFF